MSDAVFVLEEGDGPIVATAIHAGHALHPEIAALIALDEAIRMREEDPFTACSVQLTGKSAAHVLVRIVLARTQNKIAAPMSLTSLAYRDTL